MLPVPTQKSFVAIFKSQVIQILSCTFVSNSLILTRAGFDFDVILQATDALSSKYAAMVCGQTYNTALNNGLCPATGSVRISAPADAGVYKIALVSYVPPNEFGQDG